MERLKAILADKILDLTSNQDVDVKSRIDKMQRFRDFANACQALMIKYPQIEDELIKMVHDGDFDTKVASSRVDSIIRLAESGQPRIIEDTTPIILTPNEDEALAPELLLDAHYEDISNSNEGDAYSDVELAGEYHADVEEPAQIEPLPEEVKGETSTTKRVLQVVGIVAGAIALYFIGKFLVAHWVAVLVIIGVLALLAGGYWYMKNKTD